MGENTEKPFCAILVWMFFGDVLNIVRRTSEKHYSALEFKVIGIVYIANTTNTANNSIQ
jgi:hypothetical protein